MIYYGHYSRSKSSPSPRVCFYPKGCRSFNLMGATQGSDTYIKLHPDWFTGFTDAEGSFMINVFKGKGCTG
jgi:hypothetical protein